MDATLDVYSPDLKNSCPAIAMGARVPGRASEASNARAAAKDRGGQGDSPAHMLDSNTTNLHTYTPNPSPADWKRKRQKGKAFWLITSSNHWYADKASWWMTLTSAPGTRPIEKSWNALRTRMDRTTRQDIVDWLLKSSRPDFSRSEQRYALSFYLGKDLTQKIEYEYIAIKTSEGHGVYHIFLYGDMLPVTWIRHYWKHYHGQSKQIRIERIKNTSKDKAKLSRYALTQYATGQDQFVRLSHSENIIFPQARKKWMHLVESKGFHQALKLWTRCMWMKEDPENLLSKESLLHWENIPLDDIPFASKQHYRLWRAELNDWKARQEVK